MKKCICLVTDELQDIPPTGGIGTATQHLAKQLHDSGYEVTILFFGERRPSDLDAFIRYYFEKHGIVLHFLPHLSATVKETNLRFAVDAYLWFLNCSISFDVILFHEYKYVGYFCLMHKNIASCFSKTKLGAICHGNFEWCNDVNLNPLDTIRNSYGYYDLWQYELERSGVEWADFLLSPSHYLKDWKIKHLWQLPELVDVIPYTIYPKQGNWDGYDDISLYNGNDIEEIVFFGRFEKRKGIFIFIDALSLLDPSILMNRKLSFLGWDVIISKDDVRKYVESQGIVCKELKFICNYDASQARNYLKNNKSLAVMPSPGDNSPCVVYECLADRIPFIASSQGGQSELIQSDDHAYCISRPTSQALSALLLKILTSNENHLPRPSTAVVNSLSSTINFFNARVEEAHKKQVSDNLGHDCHLVSIIVTTRNNPLSLQESIDSILKQKYQNFEIIIVDLGSTNIRVTNVLSVIQRWDERIKVILQRSESVSVGISSAVKAARGKYVVFMDDTKKLFENYLQICVSTASHANAECVVSGKIIETFDESGLKEDVCASIPTGGGGTSAFAALCLVENVFEVGCCCVARDCTQNFNFEILNNGANNLLLLLAFLKQSGKQIVVLPEPYFYDSAEVVTVSDRSKYENFISKSKQAFLNKNPECISLAEMVYFNESNLADEMFNLQNIVNGFR